MGGQRGLLAGTGALLGVLVLASPASAAKAQEASFKIEIAPSQHSTWSSDFTSPGCGGGTSHATGHGERGFSMTTLKPFKIKVTRERLGSSAVTFFDSDRVAPGVPVNVAAVWDGVSTVETTGGEPCGDVDGPSPPPSDCGSRSFNAHLIFDYYSPADFPDSEVTPLVDVLGISGPFNEAGYTSDELWDELYTNCPAVGVNGGQLLLSPTSGISPKKLFGKKKTFKVKAEDTAVEDTDSSHEETKMSWTVEFKRR